MKRVSRCGDLTIHICSDCGGQILGDHCTKVENGIRRYYHPVKCTNGMSSLVIRRDVHFTETTGSTQRTGEVKRA